MSDYKEQVNSLREHADLIETSIELYGPSATRLLVYDLRNAAAAIEELQADQKKTVTQIFGEEQMAWELRCKALMYQIADLQAQLPKRGEWEREMDVNDEPFYQCSVCGECFDFNSDSTHEVFNYCPNCGADMRKMEVQDGQ